MKLSWPPLFTYYAERISCLEQLGLFKNYSLLQSLCNVQLNRLKINIHEKTFPRQCDRKNIYYITKRRTYQYNRSVHLEIQIFIYLLIF